MHKTILIAAVLGLPGLALAAGEAVDERLQSYRAAGAGPFDGEAGRRAWQEKHQVRGESRSCADCHGTDLTKAGRHVRTGRAIEPMAPSVNAARLGDGAKIEKWFLRNCKWTLGRECTPQEKGDFLSYLRAR